MARSDNPFRLTADLDAEKGGIVFKILNRESEAEVERLEVKANEVHENIRMAVGLYGLSKLLQDRTSEVPAGPGKAAAMSEVLALLRAGTWEKERQVGAPVVSAEVEALAAIYGKTVPEIQAALKGYSAEQRKAILAAPTVIAKAAEIKAKRDAAPAPTLDLTAIGLS